MQEEEMDKLSRQLAAERYIEEQKLLAIEREKMVSYI